MNFYEFCFYECCTIRTRNLFFVILSCLAKTEETSKNFVKSRITKILKVEEFRKIEDYLICPFAGQYDDVYVRFPFFSSFEGFVVLVSTNLTLSFGPAGCLR